MNTKPQKNWKKEEIHEAVKNSKLGLSISLFETNLFFNIAAFSMKLCQAAIKINGETFQKFPPRYSPFLSKSASVLPAATVLLHGTIWKFNLNKEQEDAGGMRWVVSVLNWFVLYPSKTKIVDIFIY